MPTRTPTHAERTAHRRLPAYRPRDQRETATRRGYDRDHRAWRRQVLLDHPVCRRCELEGRVEPATVAHHLQEVSQRPDLRLVRSNGVGVCGQCHNAIHRIAGEVDRFAAALQQSQGAGNE